MSCPPTFPSLLSPHFLLREIVASDIGSIYKGLSTPQVIAWYGISYDSIEATLAQMQWYRDIVQQQSGIWWAICRPEHPAELLGTCGFYDLDTESRNTDMGYWLHSEYWGQGIMYECIPVILQYAFKNMDIHRVEAEVEPQNLASRRLLGKLGFSYEGKRRQCEWREDHFIDLEYYSILAEELA